MLKWMYLPPGMMSGGQVNQLESIGSPNCHTEGILIDLCIDACELLAGIVEVKGGRVVTIPVLCSVPICMDPTEATQR